MEIITSPNACGATHFRVKVVPAIGFPSGVISIWLETATDNDDSHYANNYYLSDNGNSLPEPFL